MKPDMSLHEACYQGRLEVVRELLAQGADPNGPAAAGERVWISCAGSRPKPLNCVAIAWEVTENHLHIARLLIEHGATVDDSLRWPADLTTCRSAGSSRRRHSEQVPGDSGPRFLGGRSECLARRASR